MFKIEEEKFLADYVALLKDRENLLNEKDVAVENTKATVEEISTQYALSEDASNVLLNEMVAETEKNFDTKEIDSKIDFYKNYIQEIVDEKTIENAPEEDVAEEELKEETEEVNADNECTVY